MGWSINYNLIDGYTEIKYFGEVTKDDLQKAFEGAANYVLEYKSTLILSDCREMSGGHTLFDLFGLIEELENTDMLRSLKEAVILSANSESAANVEFWETACKNRGFGVKIFEDKEKAVVWLKS
jgi:hypothetical protein